MHAFACGQRGTLRLFANTSAMSAFLPGKLAARMAAHPAVQIETEERTSADIVSCIPAGVAQAGVVSDAVDPGPLRLDPVADDPLVLIVPPARPLAEKRGSGVCGGAQRAVGRPLSDQCATAAYRTARS